jgi:putative acetyltransferase
MESPYLARFRAGAEVCIRGENMENTAELRAIRAVNEAAFGEAEEADLVDKLRSDGSALVSLVAEWESAIVGHVLFSRMWIDATPGLVPAEALATVAVVPEHQRSGIGRRLIEQGLELLRARGERIVIVLGYPNYYPRFGFSTEKATLLEAPFTREAFMAMELVDGALVGVQGRVIYPPPFGV